jgi:hypothetical protein
MTQYDGTVLQLHLVCNTNIFEVVQLFAGPLQTFLKTKVETSLLG